MLTTTELTTATIEVESRVLLARLVDAFGYRPRLEFSRARTSKAYWNLSEDPHKGTNGGRIRITTRTWRGAREAVLHEYTHIILFHEVGDHNHDERFYITLRSVLAAVNVTDYKWETEYMGLWQMATRDGLTTAPHAHAAAKAARKARRKELYVSTVRKGQWVQWTSPKRGRQTGQVLNTRRGCRTKVQGTDGNIYLIPPTWLTLAATVTTIRVQAADMENR